ncbi:uncharacterized protein [Choristoneura fumiferana]|uniref:uncharacterized protein n=1 Tax=Choristoneura fumiferana TaxID=7141 RepID=UPI003D15A87D
MNCKRQSHHGKYICGLPTVKTCYVFAVVNAIIVCLFALGFLAWVGLLVYLAAPFREGGNNELLIAVLVAAGGYLASAISVIFAMLLLVGIRKKSPNLVKMYLLYGVVVEIILILAVTAVVSIYYRQILSGQGCAIYAAVLLCICVLYGFILRVVVHTYIVIRNGRSLHAHRTDVQVLFMLGTDGELQVLPLVR